MEVDNKTIAKYLTEVRRVNESRSKDAEKEIRKLYKGLLKELNSFIGEYYTKYSNDEGILNAAILQQNAKYAAFLEEVDKNINEITPEVSKLIKKTVEDTYKICYKGMVNAFSQAVDSEKLKESFKGLSIKPEVMKAAVQNPIGGLTLPERLKKNRQEVVYDIKQNISNALMTGERYDTTAKKMAERLDINYNKAIRIVRTESHRVQEKGLMAGAEEIGDSIREDGLVYAAVWRNMGDSRVRPNARVRTKKGWKTVKSKTHANHVKMEGQIIEAGGYFDLGHGVKAKSPGESGDAANDINCRCYVEYEVMRAEEFVERGGKLKERVEKSNNSDIIKSIDIDDFEMMATSHEIKKEVSDVIANTLKEYEREGGMYISDMHFGSFYDKSTGKKALFQVFPNAYGLTELNVNSEILAGKTLAEIDEQIRNTPVNLARNLKEAVVHECGHAKAYYQKSVNEISNMNKTIAENGVKGISYIAEADGAECIAEVEVLLYRGAEIPQEALDLYNKWTGGGKE